MAKGLKILWVNDYAYPLGGAETYALQVAEGLKSRGHELRWLTSQSRGGGWLSEVSRSVSPFHQDFFAAGLTGGSRIRRGLQQWRNPSAQRAAFHAVKTFSPGVIHLHSFLGKLSPSILTVFKKIPTVATLHTYKAICPKGTKQLPDSSACEQPFAGSCVRAGCLSRLEYTHEWLKRRCSGSAWSGIDLALAPSRYLQQVFRREVSEVEIRHLPYGTDFSCRRRSKKNGRGIVLYAGRLTEIKGVDTLIRAFATVLCALPWAQLIIAGDGPQASVLRQLAGDLGIYRSVSFLGQLDAASLVEWHEKADVVVVPSRWPENSSLSLIEALALGSAVIATEVGGSSELLQGGRAGKLVASGDVEALALAMKEILSNETLRRELEIAAQASARTYELPTHLDHLEKIYLELTLGTEPTER